MRLLDAFCKSPAGYELIPRGLSGWHMSGQGFCVLDAGQLQQLLNALKQREGGADSAYLYLPLAVHVESGCVFFLAGKSVYADVYERAAGAAREAYDSRSALFCFDYLRLNKAFWAADRGAAVGPFRLRPTFHENAGKSYTEILDDFKRYCVVGTRRVRELNEEAPAGTPDAFLWAFCAPEESEPPPAGKGGMLSIG